MVNLKITTSWLISFAFLLLVQGFNVPSSVEKKCLSDNNVTREELLLKIDQAHAEDSLENVGMKYMCYVHCVAADVNILDNNGHVDVEVLRNMEHLTENNAEVVKECNRVNSLLQNLCTYAFKMLLCLIKNIRKTEYLNISPGRQ